MSVANIRVKLDFQRIIHKSGFRCEGCGDKAGYKVIVKLNSLVALEWESFLCDDCKNDVRKDSK